MKDSIGLTILRNPFKKDEKTVTNIEFQGSTLKDFVEQCGLDGLTICHQGRVVSSKEFPLIKIRSGDIISCMPRVAGGGDNDKAILNVVLMVAIAVIGAPYLAGNILGLDSAGMAYKIAVIAATVGGGVIINSLTPTPDVSKGSEYSMSYAWNQSVQQQQGMSVPKYYGRNKVSGNIIAVNSEPDGTDNSKQLLRVLIALGQGPIKGIVGNEVYLNDLRYSAYDDVTVTERTGTVTQTSIFPETKAEYNIGILVEYADPQTYAVPDSDFDDIEVEVLFDRGLYYANDTGGISSHSVGIKVEAREAGGTWTTLFEDTVSNNKTGPLKYVYTASDEMTMVRGSSYEVRLTKTTADKTSARYADSVRLSAVRIILNDDFTYPRTAMVGVTALATNQLSGSFNFHCILDGSLVNVYDGSSWSVEFSSNPAWVLFDILTQPVILNDLSIDRYEGLDPSRIDLDKFYELAQYCDDLVSDGAGGTEKRMTFNGGFDKTNSSMWEEALQVCSVARCALIRSGTTFTVAIDKADSAVQCFSDGNIRADSFKETFLPVGERVSEVEVSFIDETNAYDRTVFTVVDSSISSYTNKAALNLVGCTRASDAWRAGKLLLAKNRLITSTIEFSVGVDAIACTIGDVIIVQSSIPDWGRGSRISGAGTNYVDIYELDDEPGKLFVRVYDSVTGYETIVEKDVVSVDGSRVYVSDFDIVPDVGAVCAIGPANIIGRKFRIMSLTKSQDQDITITAIDYSADLYDADGQDPELPNVSVNSPEGAQNIFQPLTGDNFKTMFPDDIMFRDSNINIDIPLVSGFVFSNDTPSSGSVAWNSFTITYKGIVYNIASGNASAKFIYWDSTSYTETGGVYSSQLYSNASLATASGSGKWVMGLNDVGTLYPSYAIPILHGGLIQADTITGEQIYGETLSAIKANMGTLTSGTILLSGADGAEEPEATALYQIKLDGTGLYGRWRATTGLSWGTWRKIIDITGNEVHLSFDSYDQGDNVDLETYIDLVTSVAAGSASVAGYSPYVGGTFTAKICSFVVPDSGSVVSLSHTFKIISRTGGGYWRDPTYSLDPTISNMNSVAAGTYEIFAVDRLGGGGQSQETLHSVSVVVKKNTAITAKKK